MEYNNAIKEAFLNAIISEADSGAGNAYITIRSGDAEDLDETTFYSEQVLATFPLNKPCAVPDDTLLLINGLNVRITFDLANPDAILERNGIASVWRLHKSDGATVVMGTVSELEGTGEIRFSSLDWEADGTSKVTMSFAAIGIER